ncbi:Hyaluronoglucosaminidase precursor [compost metagenome]
MTVSTAEGTVAVGTMISLATSASGSTIYYTTDGSDPHVAGLIAAGPIAITQNTVIKAYVKTTGGVSGSTYTFTYWVPSVTLTEAGLVQPGDPFTLKLGVTRVTNASGLGISVSYDKAMFEYDSAESDRNGTSIARFEHDAANGTIRYLIANTGAAGVMNGDSPAIRLQFRAKAGLADGSGSISVTHAVYANGQGLEMAMGLTSKSVSIVNAVTKTALNEAITSASSVKDSTIEGFDNGNYVPGTLAPMKAALTTAIAGAQSVADDSTATQSQINLAAAHLQAAVIVFENGKITAETGNLNITPGITIGDLAIVAFNMGLDVTSPEWETIKAADMNKDGMIDVFDLAFVAMRISK